MFLPVDVGATEMDESTSDDVGSTELDTSAKIEPIFHKIKTMSLSPSHDHYYMNIHI